MNKTALYCIAPHLLYYTVLHCVTLPYCTVLHHNTPHYLALYCMAPAGSDVIKHDGMYAAYVLASDLMGDGRYNIKIKARGIKDTTTVVVGGKGRSSGALDRTASGSACPSLAL